MSKQQTFIVDSMPKVAAHFGVGRNTVSESWRVRGMPGADGVYDVREIGRWLAKRLQGTRARGSNGRMSEAERLTLEALRNKVELERIKIDERLGKLVDAQAAQLAQEQQAAAFVGLFDRLPAEARARCGLSKEHAEGLAETIRLLREDVARG